MTANQDLDVLQALLEVADWLLWYHKVFRVASDQILPDLHSLHFEVEAFLGFQTRAEYLKYFYAYQTGGSHDKCLNHWV